MTISPPAFRGATDSAQASLDKAPVGGAAVAPEEPRGGLLDAFRAAVRLRPRRRRAPSAGRPWSRGAVVAVWALTGLALLLVWFLAFETVFSAATAARSQRELYADLREQLALGTAPLGGSIPLGSPVALLDIPAAGVHDLVVVEGTSTGTLAKGPGHRRDTPLPGQPGVAVLLGRAVTAAGVFGPVPSLQPGDVVTATTGQGTFTYRVDRVRRAGDPLPQPLASGAGRLTLVTTETDGWRTGWQPEGVVYVDSSLVGQPQPGPAHAAAVGTAEEPMQGDPSALFPTILWLQLLLVSLVAVVWSAARWGVPETWIVGLPLVLAALWGLSSSAGHLLPNLL